MNSSVVYFIREGLEGPIKIGYTSNVRQRLSLMQTGNSSQLHVIGTMPGGPDKESQLHELFSIAHIRGEWYYPIHELITYIKLNCVNYSISKQTTDIEEEYYDDD